MPKGRARKLIPKYIRPYAITACFPDTSNYVLDLPPELKARRVHPRFHVSLLQRHEPNNDTVFPSREALSYYDVGTDDTIEWMVDEIIGHEWNRATSRFHVRWTLGDHTWEPYEHCRDLAAIDDYCRLMGTGKQWMLHEDELVRHSRTWHEDGCVGARGEVRPEDVIVAAFVQLRLIGSKATDVFYSRSSGSSPPYSPDVSMERDLHDFNSALDEWFETWQDQLRQCSQAGGFHSAFIQFFQSHVRLFLNSFGLNLSSTESRSASNPEAVRQCYNSACANLQIISDFDKLHVLQYCQESITVMTAYAAIVLLKLLRAPNVMSQLNEGAVEQIHRIINNAADAYQHAGHVTGSEIDSAAYHSRFLRHRTACRPCSPRVCFIP
ncbi:hypothetical protein NUW54_g4491 [Trametes sanguinea]|uniref:Uncharacterized protein n=1 Tax=Trametes sanguinea TaxID=158606 RepID=A0ACC1PXX2_9APHY|nr:hypothetical protein NUW54_g4491 [Trametes sanguinea]